MFRADTHSADIITNNAEYSRNRLFLAPLIAGIPEEMVNFAAMKKILKVSNPNVARPIRIRENRYQVQILCLNMFFRYCMGDWPICDLKNLHIRLLLEKHSSSAI